MGCRGKRKGFLQHDKTRGIGQQAYVKCFILAVISVTLKLAGISIFIV